MKRHDTLWMGSEVRRAPTWLGRLSVMRDDKAPAALFRGVVERFRALQRAHAARQGGLEKSYAGHVRQLLQYLRAKHWSRAKGALKKLLNVLKSRAFRAKLAARIGARRAAKIVAKIASRFIPFVGWGVLIASIVWAIARALF